MSKTNITDKLLKKLDTPEAEEKMEVKPIKEVKVEQKPQEVKVNCHSDLRSGFICVVEKFLDKNVFDIVSPNCTESLLFELMKLIDKDL